MLFGIKYCGSMSPDSRAAFQSLSRFALQSISSDHSWSVCKRMIGGNIAAIDGEPESSRTDVEKSGASFKFIQDRDFATCLACNKGCDDSCAVR